MTFDSVIFLVQCQTGVVATFGILRMLAQLFKTGKREDLVDYGE